MVRKTLGSCARPWHLADASWTARGERAGVLTRQADPRISGFRRWIRPGVRSSGSMPPPAWRVRRRGRPDRSGRPAPRYPRPRQPSRIMGRCRCPGTAGSSRCRRTTRAGKARPRAVARVLLAHHRPLFRLRVPRLEALDRQVVQVQLQLVHVRSVCRWWFGWRRGGRAGPRRPASVTRAAGGPEWSERRTSGGVAKASDERHGARRAAKRNPPAGAIPAGRCGVRERGRPDDLRPPPPLRPPTCVKTPQEPFMKPSNPIWMGPRPGQEKPPDLRAEERCHPPRRIPTPAGRVVRVA